MGLMDMSAPLGIALGIEAEQNLDSLPPVRAIARRIEQAQVKHHMLPVIGR